MEVGGLNLMTERTRYGFGIKAFSHQMLLYFIPRQKSILPRFRVSLCGNNRDPFYFCNQHRKSLRAPLIWFTPSDDLQLKYATNCWY